MIDSLDLSKYFTYPLSPPLEDNCDSTFSLFLLSNNFMLTPELRYANSRNLVSNFEKSNFVCVNVFLDGKNLIDVPLSSEDPIFPRDFVPVNRLSERNKL